MKAVIVFVVNGGNFRSTRASTVRPFLKPRGRAGLSFYILRITVDDSGLKNAIGSSSLRSRGFDIARVVFLLYPLQCKQYVPRVHFNCSGRERAIALNYFKSFFRKGSYANPYSSGKIPFGGETCSSRSNPSVALGRPLVNWNNFPLSNIVNVN